MATNEQDAPRVLIVGAGAVGQVFAYHLQRGGAEIALFVRPKYADACRAGLKLHPLRLTGRRPAVELRAAAVLTTAAEVAARPWDQVWLCISSTGLRAGNDDPAAPLPWLDELLAGCGDATIVSLQPDLGDRAFLERRVPEARLVTGLITYAAYQAPIPGERNPVPEPGVAFFQPPLTANPFSGPRDRLRPVVSTLRRGGLATTTVADVPLQMAFTSAVLIPFIAVLELQSWSLAATARGRPRAQVRAVVREATAIARPGFRRWFVWLFSSAPVLWAIAHVVPRVSPFDVETYLRYHFSKVGDQTRLMLTTYRDRGAQGGRPHAALDELLARLGALDGADVASAAEAASVAPSGHAP